MFQSSGAKILQKKSDNDAENPLHDWYLLLIGSVDPLTASASTDLGAVIGPELGVLGFFQAKVP